METLEQKVARVLTDRVEIVAYDPSWPALFEAERKHLMAVMPDGLIRRVEHYGSTSVPGLAAKPVVDMLVEVESLERCRRQAPNILRPPEYDYFWKATFGNEGPPFYCWFIKRDDSGRRIHHIHMVEVGFVHWEGLIFRDVLRREPETAKAYERLKLDLARQYPDDRVAYTEAKTAFVRRVTDSVTPPAE